MRFSCPACAQMFSVSTSGTYACPHCGQPSRVDLEQLQRDPSPSAPSSHPADTFQTAVGAGPALRSSPEASAEASTSPSQMRTPQTQGTPAQVESQPRTATARPTPSTPSNLAASPSPTAPSTSASAPHDFGSPAPSFTNRGGPDSAMTEEVRQGTGAVETVGAAEPNNAFSPPQPQQSVDPAPTWQVAAAPLGESAARCAIHEEQAATGVCGRCGNFTCHDCQGMIDDVPLCEPCYYVVADESTSILWEEPEATEPLLRKFWLTAKHAMFSPREFFRQMPTSGGYGKPILFSMMVGLCVGIGFGIQFAIQFGIEGAMSQNSVPGMAGFGAGLGLAFAILMPFYQVFGNFVWAGIFHLFLRLMGGGQRGFETTFRTVCYAGAPNFWSLIPFCGGQVASFWALALMIIGAKESHRSTMGSVLLAFFIPIVLIVVLVVVFVFALFALSGGG